MSDLVGNPEDRFSHVAAQITLANLEMLQKIVSQDENFQHIYSSLNYKRRAENN